jgi:hypothetical protein
MLWPLTLAIRAKTHWTFVEDEDAVRGVDGWGNSVHELCDSVD